MGRFLSERAEIKGRNRHLRLLLNSDDDRLHPRGNKHPAGHPRAVRIERWSGYAGSATQNLFGAAFEGGRGATLNTTPARVRFSGSATSSNRLAYHCATRAGRTQMLADLLGAIRYEAWLYDSCDPHWKLSKWTTSAFRRLAGAKGGEDNKNLLELTQTISLISMLDKDKDDFDSVQMATLHASQGARVQARLPGWRGGGHLPHQSSIGRGTRSRRSDALMYGASPAPSARSASPGAKTRPAAACTACGPPASSRRWAGRDYSFSGSKTDAPVSQGRRPAPSSPACARCSRRRGEG